MRRFWHNCKGMVTVLVTLLLIPSLLVSGTAVDIARIYAARSVLQDANQLAANAALTEYDALLQDLYGLYGIMRDDPEFAGMLNEYIELAVYGDGQQQGLGTYQLFYGSELQPGEIMPASEQNLANLDVLRRQIEEYAKFRAPVVLIEGLLDRLDSFKKVQKDAEVIEQKMDLDDGLEDLEKAYKKIYEQIQVVNGYAYDEAQVVDAVNQCLKNINEQMKTLREVRDEYTRFIKFGNREDVNWAEKEADYFIHFDGIMDNIKALVSGGKIKKNWDPGHLDDEGNWVEGEFREEERISKSLEKCISDGKRKLEKYKDELDKLVDNCEAADKKKQEMTKKLNSLEQTLNAEDSCSEDLKKSLTEKKPENQNKSAIDIYRNMLKYDLTPMAQAVRGENIPHIQEAVDLLNNLAYGDQTGSIEQGTLVSLTTLKELSRSEKYALDWYVKNEASLTRELDDPLNKIANLGFSLCRIKTPGKYKTFQDSAFQGTHNNKFYEELEGMFADGSNDAKRKTAKKAATNIFAQAQEIFKGCLVYEPEGAWTYTPHPDSPGNAGGDGGALQTDFGSEGDWSKEDEGRDQAKEALHGSMVQRLAGFGDRIANRCILLVYDTEMFSNYSTNQGENTDEKSMAGIPFGVDVNYYYQSELEYLYAGNLYDAKANLKTVAGMIFLVRFVFNYIASFNIKEVNDLVSSVKNALRPIAGPFAFVIGELVRVGMALGESALDVGRIRSGHQVALFKDDDTWRFSISGLVDAAGSMSENFTVGGKEDSNLDDTGASALGYVDYLRIFLLFVDDNTLAQRTKNLIQLNVTNKKNKVGSQEDRQAREAAMTAAPLFDLSKAVTGFSITTTAELKMLFLSMPVAQTGVNGVTPPGTLTISVTDYRGY